MEQTPKPKRDFWLCVAAATYGLWFICTCAAIVYYVTRGH